MDFSKARPEIRGISIIPLINIVFLLVLFFIIAGHSNQNSFFSIDYPTASSPNKIPDNPLTLDINIEGIAAFNGKIISIQDLPNTLAYELALIPNTPILVRADRNTPAPKVVEYMQLLDAAGAKNVKLMTIAR